jgi:hypothetical protein
MQHLTVRGRSIWPVPQHPSAERIIILVHGYNNTQRQARESYRALQNKMIDAGASASAIQNTWEVYWHGFESKWITLLPRDEDATFASFDTYHEQVPKAKQAGKDLADYLCTLRPGLQVIFISHSLGGRVVLEAIGELSQQGQLHRAEAYCLMAAAVPTFLLERGAPLTEAARKVRGIVLWSKWDLVLRTPFRIGQIRAREGSLLYPPRAVAHAGEPNIWRSSHNTNLGHSGYYLPAAEHPYVFHNTRDSAQYIAPLFGRAVPREISQEPIIAWPGPPTRPLNEAKLPVNDTRSLLRTWLPW